MQLIAAAASKPVLLPRGAGERWRYPQHLAALRRCPTREVCTRHTLLVRADPKQKAEELHKEAQDKATDAMDEFEDSLDSEPA